MALLQEESSLQEIVRLVGRDSLSETDQLKLEVAKSLREDFLQQNAFHDVDTFCSLKKQHIMMETILQFHHEAQAALDKHVYLDEILDLPSREKIARMKYQSDENIENLTSIAAEMTKEIRGLIKGGDADA